MAPQPPSRGGAGAGALAAPAKLARAPGGARARTAPGKLRPLRPRGPCLPLLLRSSAELRLRARRSLPPAPRAGPRRSPSRPAPALLAGHPAGPRPARGRRVTAGSSGAAQRRGQAPGTDARPSALRGGWGERRPRRPGQSRSPGSRHCGQRLTGLL